VIVWVLLLTPLTGAALIALITGPDAQVERVNFGYLGIG
jgi:hypothetical protein